MEDGEGGEGSQWIAVAAKEMEEGGCDGRGGGGMRQIDPITRVTLAACLILVFALFHPTKLIIQIVTLKSGPNLLSSWHSWSIDGDTLVFSDLVSR